MSWILDSIQTDCRYYIGEKPCKYNALCQSCTNYSPMGKRILVIKLGAAGDALRTTAILRAFAEVHGRCHVTWVTDKISYELLKNNPFIDRLILFDEHADLLVAASKFDVVYSADKYLPAVALAKLVKADRKFGFTLDDHGSLTVFTPPGTYCLLLGLSDPLKFRRNTRTYQDFTFEMLELPWKNQQYVFELTQDEHEKARQKFEALGVTKKPVIGLNTGSGSIFATKKWPAARFVELAKRLKEQMDCTIMIMGGPAERERNNAILTDLGAPAVDAGCDNPVRVFAAMVAELDCLVTADTLAMHLGIAGQVPTIALFGPTAHAEVTLYGHGEKLVGEMDCAPCYKAVCKIDDDRACMKKIEVDQVFQAVLKALEEKMS